MGIIDIVAELVRNVMSSDPVHGYPHVMRVRKLALQLAAHYESVDREVVELAALLHDIGRSGPSMTDHAFTSARVAGLLLRAMGYSESKVRVIVEAISTHSYSAGREPQLLEAKILSDADKLDALGAVGIARVFLYSGAIGRGIEDSIAHIKTKILKLPDLMKTPEGRELALKRVKVVMEFIKCIEEELNLEK
ncbi:MAG: HD domain-containing protein [Desulfurococcales archaeon]|nr:HD domain-containing protein [Desulfurococcales archaeon]